jgi:hypothetical protein
MSSTGNLEVIGQSGALENVWEGSLTVVNPTAPDYAFSVTPTSAQTVLPGTPVVYTVTVTPVTGFTGVVSMSTSGLPATSTAPTLPQFTFTADPTPQSATVTIATSASATKRAYFPLFTSFSANSLHALKSP